MSVDDRALLGFGHRSTPDRIEDLKVAHRSLRSIERRQQIRMPCFEAELSGVRLYEFGVTRHRAPAIGVHPLDNAARFPAISCAADGKDLRHVGPADGSV